MANIIMVVAWQIKNYSIELCIQNSLTEFVNSSLLGFFFFFILLFILLFAFCKKKKKNWNDYTDFSYWKKICFFYIDIAQSIARSDQIKSKKFFTIYRNIWLFIEIFSNTTIIIFKL